MQNHEEPAKKSPFPGTDAYIEDRGLWGEFHSHLIVGLRGVSSGGSTRRGQIPLELGSGDTILNSGSGVPGTPSSTRVLGAGVALNTLWVPGTPSSTRVLGAGVALSTLVSPEPGLDL